jgi:hypothetical protein
LLVSIGLLALGLLLTFVPNLFFPVATTPADRASTLWPPPTWNRLPTRIPTSTPSPTLDLASTPVQTMREALVQRDYIAAQAAWNAAHQMAPQSHLVAREGARLALARDQLHFAESRIWQALRTDAHDAMSWVLLGATYARRSEFKEANQAWGIAQSLDPALAMALFPDRWYAARQTYNAGQGADNLSALAYLYSQTAPEDPLSIYYQRRADCLRRCGFGHPAATQRIAKRSRRAGRSLVHTRRSLSGRPRLLGNQYGAGSRRLAVCAGRYQPVSRQQRSDLRSEPAACVCLPGSRRSGQLRQRRAVDTPFEPTAT